MLTVYCDGTILAQLKSFSYVCKSKINASCKVNACICTKATIFLCFGSGFKENVNGKW